MRDYAAKFESTSSARGDRESAEATEILADKINDVLIHAVKSGDYSDPCFCISLARGGSHTVGGTYWTDAGELSPSADADVIRQIVGHTRQGKITANSSGRIINVDVGICFGGRAYVEIRDGKVTPVDCGNTGHGRTWRTRLT